MKTEAIFSKITFGFSALMEKQHLIDLSKIILNRKVKMIKKLLSLQYFT